MVFLRKFVSTGLTTLLAVQLITPSALAANESALPFERYKSEIKATSFNSMSLPSEFIEALGNLRIHTIQGEQHTSPYNKEIVKNVIGIVTKTEKNGFYMQDPKPDHNSKTSEGIYVYSKNHQVQKGNLVLVSGQVNEYIGQGYSDKAQTDLAGTQINAHNIVIAPNNPFPLPKPVKIGKHGMQIPEKRIDSDAFSVFNPKVDAIDFYESLEGMMVELHQPKIIAPQKNGNLSVVVDNKGKKVSSRAGTPLLQVDNFNPERLFIKVPRSTVTKAGDFLNGNVTGIVGYDYGNYRISPVDTLPAIKDGGLQPTITNIRPAEDKLTVATYNIENFSANTKTTNNDKVAKLATSIVTNLKSPDIIGVQEMQDNNGETNDGTTDASKSAQRLIDAIAVAGGPTYKYVDIAPQNNQDGGAPGANIRVGFLYNPNRVDLVDNNEVKLLTANPIRIGETDELFQNTRKPLAAEFSFNGEHVVVVANHLNSKRGDATPFGQIQPLELKSEPTRIQLAQEINTFMSDILAKEKNATVIAVGDMNDFEFSKPMQALKGKSMKNMTDSLPKEKRYTYIHEGNAQTLDHILVSNNVAKNTVADIVRMNSEFMKEHGRVSDHDPVLAQISFKHHKKK
jgi:uncharacterized protein